MAPKISISGELIAAAATERRFALNKRCAALAKSSNLPRLHAESLHDAIAGDGLVKNVLNVGQLVLASPGGLPYSLTNASSRKNDEWHE